MVRITWLDSFGVTADWEDDDAKPMQPVRITSVGFVRNENKTSIEIIQSKGGSQILGRMCIPKICILKMEKLNP